MAYLGQPFGQGQAERFIFTATGGETTVTTADDTRSIAYNPGQVDVYLNGSKQVVGTDVTATTGTDVTFTVALAANDVVDIVALDIFQAADHLPLGGGTMTGPLIFTSGNGVDFSATANATGTNVSINSEILSDYEEGTWEPQIADGVLEAPGYAFRSGRYTKIGNTVTVQGDVQVNDITGLTGSNGVRIGNLPFTCGGLNSAGVVSYATGLAITSGTNVSCYVVGSQSYISVTQWDATSGISNLVVSELTANGRLMFSATYTV